jgi:hypothetical protein
VGPSHFDNAFVITVALYKNYFIVVTGIFYLLANIMPVKNNYLLNYAERENTAAE